MSRWPKTDSLKCWMTQGYNETRMDGENARPPRTGPAEFLNAWKAGHYLALTYAASDGELFE